MILLARFRINLWNYAVNQQKSYSMLRFAYYICQIAPNSAKLAISSGNFSVSPLISNELLSLQELKILLYIFSKEL